ncbi:MAG TPA: sugar phosphate isomerase/epimerase [Chthoniobacterales bacterium]
MGLLRDLGVRILEVAPARLFKNVAKASASDIALKRRFFGDNGFRIASLQAILYGKDDLLLFESSTRPLLFGYLCRIAEVASLLGANSIVFGAPRNRRVPSEMSESEAWDIATAFFAQLGQAVKNFGVTFGIEAVPPVYGCNFCMSSNEAARLARTVAQPAIAWHVDTGTMAFCDEDPARTIGDNVDVIGSVHISQPYLADFENPWNGHKDVAAALGTCGYSDNFTIEMKASERGLPAIQEAVDCARRYYPC